MYKTNKYLTNVWSVVMLWICSQ